VQRILGHSVPSTTLNLYIQAMAGQGEKAVAAAGSVMRQIRGGIGAKPGSQRPDSRIDCNQTATKATEAALDQGQADKIIVKIGVSHTWRGGRVVECGGLENRKTR
jgi:hypothetical protein